jgi:type I restriction enzyme M protein
MTTEALKKLEDDLWAAADTLRANSGLKASSYSTPVLGLIFLKFADNRYSLYEKDIEAQFKKLKGSRKERSIEEIALEKCGFYLPPEARYSYLLELPEKKDLAAAIKTAMKLVEEYKPELADTLPKNEYAQLNRVKRDETEVIDNTTLKKLLKNFQDIPVTAGGDIFGQIYEYFLGNFALAEGAGGGEFFTPRSVVKLMVEIIQPHDGTVFDPACGSGGMFVQSAQFIDSHRNSGDDPATFVYGVERTPETVKLAKMNLAVNGLRGDIRHDNSYYSDPHKSFGRFDYVLANPPFNVDDVSLAKVEKDRRFNTYGIPRNKGYAKAKDKAAITVPNANYLWITLFATSLNEKGRAALVMANSASDARNSEADIRKNLIEHNLISSMLTLPSNMFYTVTLPATLWFFDKAKTDDRILFIDARNVFTQIDRAHRAFTDEQVRNLGLIGSLRRGEREAFVGCVQDYFSQGFASLASHLEELREVAARVLAFLKEGGGTVLPDFAGLLKEGAKLAARWDKQCGDIDLSNVEKANKAQRRLMEEVRPFFASLHALLKDVDKGVRHIEQDQGRNKDLRHLKAELEGLHAAAKGAEYFFTHITWLQERFPSAAYEDVTGLCKLASRAEIQEQEYSLNPGRYVGVVIEEDGKTEEEFIEEILALNAELEGLNAEAQKLEKVIAHNIRQIAGEE